MTDSLDMLLNMRQPSAGRRAVPPPAASPARSPSRGDYGGSSSASGGSGVGSSFSYGGASRPSVSTASLAPYASQGQRKDSGYGSSSTPTHPSRVGSASASGSGLSASPSFDRPAHSPSASPKGNADTYGYGHAYGSNHNDNARSGYQQQQQAQSQQSQQSQPQSHYSEPASPVNWGHFKAVAAKQRVGSAHASQTAGASNGPNHAAAGLSDAYVSSQQRAAPAAAAPASPSPSQSSALHTRGDANKRADSDSTVIGGAVIFPLKAAPRVDTAGAAAAPSTSGGLTPLKRNPFASPTAASAAAAAAPNASPFATATSGFTRPAPLGSPTAAASGGVDGAGTAVRAVQTFSCPDCGRSFKRGSLMKHQKVCKKVFKQKREQFDSAKVRTQGLTQGDDEESDEEEEDDEEGRPRTAAPGAGASAAAKAKKGGSGASAGEEHKESNWKDQSAGLREAMRRAKLEKARFGQSNAMGIDMSKMMMR